MLTNASRYLTCLQVLAEISLIFECFESFSSLNKIYVSKFNKYIILKIFGVLAMFTSTISILSSF